MKIFITGADGMLGSNLARMLLERGHELTVFINSNSYSGTLDGLDIKRFTGSILEPETLIPAMKGNDVVIHGAASTSVWPARSEIVRRINIDGTRNMVEEALRCNVKRFIYIGSGSSVNAPGETGGKYLFPGAKYGLDYIDSKYEALNLVLDAAKKKGLPAISILPTYMIDAYDSLPGSGRMIQAVAKGQLKFYTGGGRNFVSAKDVATAIVNSLEMGEVGKYYIAGNENLTYREFFAKVAKIVGKPSPALLIPDWLVKSIGKIRRPRIRCFWY